MQLFLKPDEQKFIALAVVNMLDQLEESSKNQFINWNPDARGYLKDMLSAGNGLKIKLGRLGFDMRDLPPFIDGDEEDFLTKQS